MKDFFKFASENARQEFTPERFWVHFVKVELSGYTTFDLDFPTLTEARDMAEQLVQDGDAESAEVTARHQRISATYSNGEWEGDSAAYLAYLQSEIDPRD